jgi:hypothetical protein
MTHPDLEQLKGMLLRVAQKMVSKEGEFYPFGVSISTDGQFTSEDGYKGDEHPSSATLNNEITQKFRQLAASGQLRAAGICLIVDMSVIPPGQTERTKAIHLALEHQSGQSEYVFVPFKKGLFGKVKYGEPYPMELFPQFFVHR